MRLGSDDFAALAMRKSSKQAAKTQRRKPGSAFDAYNELLTDVVRLIEQARISGVRSANVVLTSAF